MKKRILSVTMALMLILTLIPATVVHANDIRVTIDGHEVIFPDQRPTIVGGRTLVPVRGVFEALGFEIAWDGETNTAILGRHDYRLLVPIGSSTFTTNGVVHTLDVPAQIIGSRTMLPLRLPLESVGYALDWDSVTRTVLISPSVPEPILPRSVTLSFLEISLILGDTTTIEANVQPADAEDLTVVWESSNQDIVTVSESGLLTAVSRGTAKITARIVNGITETATVTIPTSSITLPNRRLTVAERQEWMADYWVHGGPTDVELEVVRLVNIERTNHGLTPVEIDDTLMMAARFFAQQAADIGGASASGSDSHNFGPYATDPSAKHGASANVAAAFGANLRWNGGNWHSGGSSSAERIVTGWMNSDGHRSYILSPEHRFIGMGQYPGGVSYMFLSDRASD
jgi:uncharacterized protein YkwD